MVGKNRRVSMGTVCMVGREILQKAEIYEETDFEGERMQRGRCVRDVLLVVVGR
jgi:hypothetical protein